MSFTARIALALAVLNLMAHWAAIGWAFAQFPKVLILNWLGMAALTLPPTLTLAAAILVWSDRTPLRLVVAIGNGLLLFNGLVLVDRVFVLGLFTPLGWLTRCLSDGYPGVALATVLLPPALAGWWQRRQDRLAHDEDAG